MNIVHKYTDIYNGIDLLVLKGIEGGLVHIHLHLLSHIYIYRDIYDVIGLLALKA